MTLIVSLRTPDGIVIAGDSLATMNSNIQVDADIDVNCPNCNHNHQVNQMLGNLNVPATTLSYAQKIFPFLDKYVVGVFGQSILAGKSVNFAIRQFEADLKPKPITQKPKNVTEVASKLSKYLLELLQEHYKIQGADINALPDNSTVVGLHIVGYDKHTAKSIIVFVGKDIRQDEYTTPAITVSGDIVVFNGLDAFHKNHNHLSPVYPLFSLQDAIEYAEFMINTTASIQHFSQTMATVGGDIDIALVTPFEDFKWIKQKSLQSKLVGGYTNA